MRFYGWELVLVIGANLIVVAVLLGLLFTMTVFDGDTETEDKMASFYADFKADIIHAEGLVKHVYLDTEGIKTAGIGHRLVGDETKMEVGVRVYDEQIDAWFDADFRRAMGGVAKYFHDFQSYPRLVQLAILNWIYQLGPDAPHKFPLATAAIIARDWEAAALQWEYADKRLLRKSKWALQTPARCEQECARLRASVGK